MDGRVAIESKVLSKSPFHVFGEHVLRLMFRLLGKIQEPQTQEGQPPAHCWQRCTGRVKSTIFACCPFPFIRESLFILGMSHSYQNRLVSSNPWLNTFIGELSRQLASRAVRTHVSSGGNYQTAANSHDQRTMSTVACLDFHPLDSTKHWNFEGAILDLPPSL